MSRIIERPRPLSSAKSHLIDIARLSPEEQEELIALGMLSTDRRIQEPPVEYLAPQFQAVEKRAICAPDVLNEAYAYDTPSSFSRGLRVELPDYVMLIISGTASVDEYGATVHVGDFRAQCWRTYRNITRLLASEGATWRDVVKCTCYLRDIERDYKDFNHVRTAFFKWLKLDPLPASVGIQARLCREDLLVEIEAMAIVMRAKAQA
ncbi:MAG TPA: Rid family hydrolase [Acidobacteriota bacterium]|nr:Rid family hydrolase [Acidobacteriota bacterium]